MDVCKTTYCFTDHCCWWMNGRELYFNQHLKKTNICPGRLHLCLGFWKEHLFEHSPFWVITLLQPLWMKNCWTLTTSFLLTTLTPVLHSSETSFINWFGLVALFGTQDKCVQNNWTYCQWTLPAAISAGSETIRWCLMNGGICGKYWSFHKTYRDGDRQWTLMDWMLWGSTWNQTVVDAIMDAFSRPPRRRQPTQYSRGQCLWVLQKESASASAPTVPQGFSVFCSTSLAQLEGKGAASATKKTKTIVCVMLQSTLNQSNI